MNDAITRRRCAVYTRKSNEEGLEQNYNSIQAQRDAGHAYIASQRNEGWIPVGEDYDDPAFSGGNMDRPALKKLLADIDAGKIDVVVVYKIDRLTRSLADFARMIEVFERQKVSFVSVTQQFNTTTSMGRLMLNVLLSFAQFEREVTGERIRDKIAASKKKGMWMGGVPPLGYDVKDRRLIINAVEADLVRHIFQRFVDTGSTTKLVHELRLHGARTKAWTTQDGKTRTGKAFDKGNLYKMLHNRHYLGEISHGRTWYPAQHEAIVQQSVWAAAHAILATNSRTRANHTRSKTPFLLRGLIFCENGRALTTSSNRNRFGRVYRYYLSTRETKEHAGASGLPRIPAAELESAVMAQLRTMFRDPKLLPPDAQPAIHQMDAAWAQFFPEEQARIVRKLVQRVVVRADGIDIQLRPGGIAELAQEFAPQSKTVAAAEEAFA